MRTGVTRNTVPLGAVISTEGHGLPVGEEVTFHRCGVNDRRVFAVLRKKRKLLCAKGAEKKKEQARTQRQMAKPCHGISF